LTVIEVALNEIPLGHAALICPRRSSRHSGSNPSSLTLNAGQRLSPGAASRRAQIV
jgi:hypothetical protein